MNQPQHSRETLKNGQKGAEAHTVSEEYRIKLTKLLMNLREDESTDKLEFPPSLTNTERKFVHELCAQLGLKSKSTGKGEARHIIVSKLVQAKKDVDGEEDIPELNVGKQGLQVLQKHLERFPPTEVEAMEALETGSSLANALTDEALATRLEQMGLAGQETVSKTFRETRVDWKRRQTFHGNVQKQKQKHKKYAQMLKMRQRLPAFEQKDRIVQTVADNPVTIVSGETGCGTSLDSCRILFIGNKNGRMYTCSHFLFCFLSRQVHTSSTVSIGRQQYMQDCGDTTTKNFGHFHSGACRRRAVSEFDWGDCWIPS